MNFDLDDTIAALASAPGPAARGIIRISGPEVKDRLERLFRADEPEPWQSARAATRHPGRLSVGGCHAPLPVSVYFWPASSDSNSGQRVSARSYTGEPMAELHTVGSPPLLEAVLSELHAHGVRPARPGEFTLRAFLTGRIDLVQAEAVLGVVDAHDHRELETALSQMAGGISGPIAGVQADLLELLSDLEAGLDFVEEDIEFVGRDEVVRRLTEAGEILERLQQEASTRMQSKGRYRVVLAGLPNAGKSTLFNALVGRQAALVSEIQGTTRDYLSAELDWNGTAVELIDTAGWEQFDDEHNPPVAHGGIRSIHNQAQTGSGEQRRQADLVLWCTASDIGPPEQEQDNRQLEALHRQDRPVLRIVTKTDRVATAGSSEALRVSAHTASGLNELIDVAVSTLSGSRRGSRQLLGTTAARCRDSLDGASRALQRAAEAAALDAGDEILAIEIREALDGLGVILGTVYTDDILDRIFHKFCIGK